MPKVTLRLSIALAASVLLVLSGCALDPMERLSEEIDSQEVATKAGAVLELANLEDERAIEALVEVLESDEDVFDLAGVALVKQGRETVTEEKPDPVITMVAGVMKNVHLPVGNRSRAAWVLGEIGDREAIDALRAGAAALLASGAVATVVRTQAGIGLKKLGDSSVGVAFELPMGSLEGIQVTSLPEVPAVAPIEEAEEDVDEEEADAEDAVAPEEPAEDEDETAAGEETATDEEPTDEAAAPSEEHDTAKPAETNQGDVEDEGETDDKTPADEQASAFSWLMA